MAYLELKLAGGQYHKIFLQDGPNTVGNGEQATIRIKDPLIAPEQALITPAGDAFHLRNLVPSNTIYLNGSVMTEEAVLGDGDELIMGSTRCRFHLLDLDRTQEMLEISVQKEAMEMDQTIATARRPPETVGKPLMPTPPSTKRDVRRDGPTPRPPAPPPLTRQDLEANPYLEITEPGQATRFFPLNVPEITVGTRSECDLCLNDPNVDERHLKFIVREEMISVTDMDSRSGVLLNGKRVAREVLKDGDQIKIGHTLLVFHPPMSPEPGPEEEAGESPAAAAMTTARAESSTKPFFQRWALLLPLIALLFVAMALVAFLIFRAIYQPKAAIGVDDARAALHDLLHHRQWEEAQSYLEQKPVLPLPDEDFTRFRQQIETEKRSARYAEDVAMALAKDQFNPALDLYFKIPDNSVYHPEVSRRLINHLEKRVDDILDRPASTADYSAIIDLSEKMLQVRPQYKPALAYICLAYIGQRLWPEARQAAETMVRTWPEAAEGYYYLAQAIYWQGHYDTALIPINEALRLDPENAEYLFLRAKIEILMERLNDARLDLDQVLKERPQWATARDLYKKLTGQQPMVSEPDVQRTAEEEDQHRQMLQQRRDQAEWDRGEQKARAAFTAGNPDQATRELGNLMTRYPKSKRHGNWQAMATSMKRIETLNAEAETLSEQDFTAAVAKWEQMREIEKNTLGQAESPFAHSAAQKIAAFYTRRAAEDVQQGEMARAYILAGKALEWDPRDAEAVGIRRRVEDRAADHYREGFRLYQHGNLDDARKNWEEVCRLLEPENPWYKKAREKLDELQQMK
ncbi:MAG: FHA domain-containing protein [Acidobacteria bacterium]|nr:FHA domain-containing protein [Acidobacteriota bacterium]